MGNVGDELTRGSQLDAELRPRQVWDEEKFKQFAIEIDRIKSGLESSLGAEDVRYAKSLQRFSRSAEALGRFLLHVSLDPVTWFVGVTALWLHKQLETTEIGHYALHGCWDRFEELPELHSKSYRWKTPAEEETWKRGHNQLHHQFTNIVGKDPDVNYGSLRTSSHVPWSPYHAVQIIQFFVTAPFFMEVINVYNTGLTDLLRKPKMPGFVDALPDRKPGTIAKALGTSLKKLLPYWSYNYLFWPLLAGPFWWKVFLGNLLAEGMCNVYTAASIYAGHFGEDTVFYPPDFKAHSRGEWYKSQVEAAHNFKVPKLVSILCGTLNAQIEHHLFPKIPPNRLRSVTAEVEEVCRRHGVSYAKDGWGATWARAIAYLWKMSSRVAS